MGTARDLGGMADVVVVGRGTERGGVDGGFEGLGGGGADDFSALDSFL